MQVARQQTLHDLSKLRNFSRYFRDNRHPTRTPASGAVDEKMKSPIPPVSTKIENPPDIPVAHPCNCHNSIYNVLLGEEAREALPPLTPRTYFTGDQ